MTVSKERLQARIAERARWAEFTRIYDRCVAIADSIWGERLDSAQVVQQQLAEGMRDRGVRFLMGEKPSDLLRTDGAINVPLFTPRDREQFIKEASVTLFIEACKRNLTARS